MELSVVALLELSGQVTRLRGYARNLLRFGLRKKVTRRFFEASCGYAEGDAVPGGLVTQFRGVSRAGKWLRRRLRRWLRRWE